MRLAIVQMNATVGAIAANAERIRAGIKAALSANADLVLFPELALTGYPPEDLLLHERFLADARFALEGLAADAVGLMAIVGFPEREERIYNSAAVLAKGRIQGIYRKIHLPNYGVFDERRYFAPGTAGAVLEIGEGLVGLTICEDIWEQGPPASEEARAGVNLIINISASPYHAGKGLERERMLAERARESTACVAFCALVGGQDELVFDGHSCVFDHRGKTIARAGQFVEEMLICDLDLSAARGARASQPVQPLRPSSSGGPLIFSFIDSPAERVAAPAWRHGLPEPDEGIVPLIVPLQAEIYAALMLGVRDYVEKNGFNGAVLGLSGGIDSALVVCLAVDALGPERINVAIMPSPYSSQETRRDALALAKGLGVSVHELPIDRVMGAYGQTLDGELTASVPDLTGENIQARIRGNLLMALSNQFGWLVLATGNKSEMSVGYTTLYGDLAGGLAVIKDVPKSLVYELASWRNSADAAAHGLHGGGEPAEAPIPASIIARAPTAELREGQRDEDSLPPYPLLDQIIRGYVELDEDRDELIARGLPEGEVDSTLRLIDRAEYKRRQAPPGIKITTRAFGRDRRMPITNRYRY